MIGHQAPVEAHLNTIGIGGEDDLPANRCRIDGVVVRVDPHVVVPTETDLVPCQGSCSFRVGFCLSGRVRLVAVDEPVDADGFVGSDEAVFVEELARDGAGR